MTEQAEQVRGIVDTLWPTLQATIAGKNVDIQGAVLADIVSIWLAGQIIIDHRTGEIDRELTEKHRAHVIDLHAQFVRKLVPVNEEMLLPNIQERAREAWLAKQGAGNA